mmetsp:Transcript_45770/g.68088  ORF Transcript_45770/g.68088 Transcript_45770/m.68088 type:complete len:430 (-) Transcript_45770:1209-2498(-)
MTQQPVWSSGVAFYPPSTKYWRIGNEWYDLSTFEHPGGNQILRLARDRFEDCTFVFEAHHHNYIHARNILKKYKVTSEDEADKTVTGNNSNKYPRLLGHGAFYSVIRRRVADHLKQVNCKDGGPTKECLVLFWVVFVLWCTGESVSYLTGSIVVSLFTGLVGTWLGAFGHNWVHQPKYKRRGWALLSLDTLGFSSEGWYREHLLQHHMYTNTPWDNHFKGTDPFLVTDPTVERHWFQRYVLPYVHPIILSFGTYGNYIAHTTFLLQGQEEFSVGKLFFLLEHLLFWHRWGFLHGVVGLLFLKHALLGNYYFTCALMNHNAEHTMDVKARNAAKDWGHAQMLCSADWGEHLTFFQAGLFLWLNFHTAHHMFPRVDFSHHPAIHRILMRTCDEFKIKYTTGTAISIYKEMIHSFSTPQSLMQEITIYAGGL